MPNFLSAALGVGNSIRTSGTSGLFNPSGFQGAVTAALSGGLGAGAAPLGLGALGLPGILGGRGTKPMALHTEYAAETANWVKPYGMGTDIVFYLQRADQTSSISDTTNNFGGDLSKDDRGNFNSSANALTTNALPTNVGGVEPGLIPANVQAGPNGSIPKAQTPFSQIATSNKLGTLVLGGAKIYERNNLYQNTQLGASPTAVGFLTNFNKSANTQSDSITSQSAVVSGTLSQNVTQSLGSGTVARYSPGFATSTKYWSDTANNSFNPSGIRSPFEVPTSEFSSELAFSSGGVNSSEYYRDLSLDGDINATAPIPAGSTALAFSDSLSGLASLFGGFGSGNTGADIPSEWYFITAPQEISWSKESEGKEMNTYGSNGSYISYATTKLRKLQLGSALVEGFSDGKAVEDNILQLEKCMKMVLSAGNGYASPYCWNVYAGGKSYGTYLITSVKVKESMRDTSGHATRAMVDIELQEVPSYQVSNGIDLVSRDIAATPGDALEANRLKAIEAAKQKASGNAVKNQTRQARQQDNSVQNNKPEKDPNIPDFDPNKQGPVAY